MNQHPIYMTADTSRDSSPHGRVLETLTAAENQRNYGGGMTRNDRQRTFSNMNNTNEEEQFTPMSSYHHTQDNNRQQPTTYYSPPVTSFHPTSSFASSDRKDHMMVSGLAPTSSSSNMILSNGSRMSSVRLPTLSSSLTTTPGMFPRGVTKEHPAAVQADQMNAYMDSYFVDHEQSTSGGGANLEEEDDDELDDEHLEKYDGLREEEKSILMDEKREIQLNKRRQRERERKELDDLLRESHDYDIGSEEKIKYQRSKERRAEAARSRYQKMTEAERRLYNQKRRLRSLGLDPECPSPHLAEGSVKEHIKMANAKKAEAARLRYHRMTLAEKREYNQRRTEAFRRRRMEEEMLLSTPAGRISNEALQKAQQIMIRNARKAEAARSRYQKMTPEDRKEYNLRRAQAKKSRTVSSRAANSTDGLMSSDCSMVSNGELSSEGVGMNNSFITEPSSSISMEQQTSEGAVVVHSLPHQQQHHQPSLPPPPTAQQQQHHHHQTQQQQQHQLQHQPPTQQPRSRQQQHNAVQDDVFLQMERDVVKRTKQAKMAIARQNQQHLHSTFHLGGDHKNNQAYLLQDESLLCDDSILMDGGQTDSNMMDNKPMRSLMMTGYDTHGNTIELRSSDGQTIIADDELRLVSHGVAHSNLQKPRIQQTSNQPVTYLIGVQPSSNPSNPPLFMSHEVVIDNMQSDDGYHHTRQGKDILAEATAAAVCLTTSQRTEQTKARRAERARQRYQNMDLTTKQQQNARRAEMLRKSRTRDEELCQLAERAPPDSLDNHTKALVMEAQNRRARRAEQARAKYHRMNSEERRQYNAMRDAQRRQRKREQETHGGDSKSHCVSESDLSHSGNSPSQEQMIYSTYDLYPQPMQQWEN